jgi:hypothetical protein
MYRKIILSYKKQVNRVLEMPFAFNYKEKSYIYRQMIIFDQELFASKKSDLTSRLDKTINAFTELEVKINTYCLKTYESIEQTIQVILNEQSTSYYFSYKIVNDPIVTYKNNQKDQDSQNMEPEETVPVYKDHFRIELRLNEDAVEKYLAVCGYYSLLTNKMCLFTI